MTRRQYKSVVVSYFLSTEELNEYAKDGYLLHSVVSCKVNGLTYSDSPGIQYIFYKEIKIPKEY